MGAASIAAPMRALSAKPFGLSWLTLALELPGVFFHADLRAAAARGLVCLRDGAGAAVAGLDRARGIGTASILTCAAMGLKTSKC